MKSHKRPILKRSESRMILKIRTKLSAKRILVFAASFMIVATTGLIIFFNLSDSRKAHALASGDYRTKASGTWNTVGIWERYNGSAWVAAAAAPTSANGAITIQSPNKVTVSTAVTVDQVTIDAGATLYDSSATLTINDGTGVDITVNGTLDIGNTVSQNNNSSILTNGTTILRSTGTISNGSGSTQTIGAAGRFRRDGGTMPTSSYWTVNSTGTFQHNMNGSTLPSATWNTGSTCEVTGITTSLPSALNQTFKNFTWNCTSQTAAFDFGGSFQSVNGDLTVSSTGTGSFQFDMQGNNTDVVIGGNFNLTGGLIYGCTNGSATIDLAGNYVQTGGTFAFTKAGGTAYGNTSTIMNVTGNMNISGGTMDLSQCDANNSTKGIGQVYVKGNIALSSSGLVTETSSASSGQIFFNGTSAVQYFTTTSLNTVTNTVDFTVNSGAILRMDNQIIPGGGAFSLLSGGGIMLGDANGITLSGASGNIQVTGTRTYSTGADYTYNGSVAQNSGNGLPSTVHNLTLNNSNNLTLTSSSSVSNILTFTAGLFIATNDTLTLGTSTAVLGTLSRTSGHVVGYFRRWIAAATTSNILFPVGTLSYYNGANFSFTTAPTAGSIVCSFVATNPGTLGLPLLDAGDICNASGYAYWSLAAMNSFAGGVYSVNLYANGFPGIADYTKLHLFRRTGSGASWTINGTHAAGTGSNAAPVVNRTGMNVLGHYGVVSGNANTLPIELIYFNAQLNNNRVELSWATASELNNDFFTVERSTDAKKYEPILRKAAAGNSTATLYYTDADEKPLSGNSYYRLKQTDYDGHFTYSSARSISNRSGSEEESPLKITSVSPNPFSEQFALSFRITGSATIGFQLYSSSGQQVYKDMILATDGMNQYDFVDRKGLTPGIYFIVLAYDDKKISQKIIKR